MKKIFFAFGFLFFQFIFAEENFFKYAEFDLKSVFNLKEKDSSYSVKGGSKILLKGMDLRIFDSSQTCKFDEDFLLKKFQFGAGVNFLDLFNIPLVIKVGNLSQGGSVSKMNSPSLSNYISPFSNSVSSVSGIEIFLPSVTSSEKPYSASASVNLIFKEKESFLKKLNFSAFCDSDLKFISSVFSKFSLGKKKSMQASLNFGFFTVEKEASSWKSKVLLYPETRIFSANFQWNMISPVFDSFFSMNVYESPFSEVNFTFSSQNKIKVGHFSVGFQGFFSTYDEIITSSGKNLTSLFQLKFLPEFKVFSPNNKFMLNFGFSSFLEKKKVSVFDEPEILGKSSLGIELRTLKMSSRFVFGTNYLDFSEFDFKNVKSIFSKTEYVFSLKSYFYDFFNSSLSFSYSFFSRTESVDFSSEASISFYAYFFSDKSLKSYFKISSSVNEEKISSIKPEVVFYYRKKIKFFVLNLSCGMNYTFK